MTKRRPPLTYEDAMTRIAGRLTFARCAEIVGRSESLCRIWSDPDRDELPNLRQAQLLDAAFVADGGGEPPFLSVTAAHLEFARIAGADAAAALAPAIKLAVKEVGEGLTAGAALLGSAPSRGQLDTFIAEAGEAVEALTKSIGTASAMRDRLHTGTAG